MKTAIEFSKLSGSGNDFICVDNLDGRYDELLQSPHRVAHFSRVLCRRGLGVGADGLIFASQPEVRDVADLAARFFEGDGSETELCGNGTACFVHWATQNDWTGPGDEFRVLTSAGVVRGHDLDDGYTQVCVPNPERMEKDISLTVKGEPWTCDLAIVGTPHVIAYVDDVDKVDIAHWGPGFRYHKRFAPRGANANFVQILGPREIAIRTWEFGVEGETLACGTGSAAAAIMTADRQGWSADCRDDGPIYVHAHSGDVLRIYVNRAGQGRIDEVCLETRVRYSYIALLESQLAEEALAAPAPELDQTV